MTPNPEASVIDVHVDPRAEDLVETKQILDVVYRTETLFDLAPGTAIVLYGSSQESVDWAHAKAQELGCLTEITKDDLAYGVGVGEACGFLMRIDAMSLTCEDGSLCKTGLNVGAHELYHTVFNQQLDSCACAVLPNGRSMPTWMIEGLADYVGYALVYGTEFETIEKSWRDLRDRANRSEIATGLSAMEPRWILGLGSDWYQYLYDRAYFAVTLLVQKFGEQKVFIDLLDRVLTTGDYKVAFQETFGVSEDDFDAEFKRWVVSPSAVEMISDIPTPSTPRSTTSLATDPVGATFTGSVGDVEPREGRLIGLTWNKYNGTDVSLIATTRTDSNGEYSIAIPLEFHRDAPWFEDGGYCLVFDMNNDDKINFFENFDHNDTSDSVIDCEFNVKLGSTIPLMPLGFDPFK